MDEGSQDETPPCRLERVHTIVSRRISDRNRNPNFAQDLETTRQLDKELLDASRALPDTFWSPPDFEDILPDTREGFVRTMHLCDQFHHHNLVHLLHLPYLLRNEKQSSFYVYSKITCLNACRDLIQGFVAFRKFYCNILAVYCRTGDFMALMAGMTILLAHIDSHKLGVRDWRAHQRASDRGLVEQLCRIMEKVARQTNDNITNEAATQLRRLMIIESDASRGMNTSTESTLACLEEHCGQFKLTIPYFGIIKIDREGVTKDVPAEADLCQPQFPSNPASVHVANHVLTAAGYDYTLPPQQPQMSMLLAEDNTGQISAPQLHGTMNNAYIELNQPQTQLPGVAASINDWTFQGVDAAFFESVMRGTSGWDSPLPTDL